MSLSHLKAGDKSIFFQSIDPLYCTSRIVPYFVYTYCNPYGYIVCFKVMSRVMYCIVLRRIFEEPLFKCYQNLKLSLYQ
jgi:hypothetical protein